MCPSRMTDRRVLWGGGGRAVGVGGADDGVRDLVVFDALGEHLFQSAHGLVLLV